MNITDGYHLFRGLTRVKTRAGTRVSLFCYILPWTRHTKGEAQQRRLMPFSIRIRQTMVSSSFLFLEIFHRVEQRRLSDGETCREQLHHSSSRGVCQFTCHNCWTAISCSYTGYKTASLGVEKTCAIVGYTERINWIKVHWHSPLLYHLRLQLRYSIIQSGD